MNWLTALKERQRNRLVIDIQTGEVLSGTLDIAVLKKIIEKNFPKHHLAHSPGDTRREKKLARESAPNIIAKLVSDGWMVADNPPNTNRTVQVAWDDGSYGQESLAFYDGKSEIPQGPEKYWWSHPHLSILPTGSVIAWRERDEAQKDTLGD